MCLPRDGLAERVRRDARPRRRRLPARPRRRDRPRRARYLPGTMVLETSWETAHRLGDRARRAAASGPGTTRASARTPTAARPPTTTPTTCCCGPCGASTARSRSTSTASRSFDYGRARGGLGATRAPATTRRIAGSEGMRAEAQAAHRHATSGSRARAPGARTGSAGGRARVLRAVLVRAPAARTTFEEAVRAPGVDRAPLAALARRRATSPTIPGAPTCSAAR